MPKKANEIIETYIIVNKNLLLDINFGFPIKQSIEIIIHTNISTKTTGLQKKASINWSLLIFMNILVIPQPGHSIPVIECIAQGMERLVVFNIIKYTNPTIKTIEYIFKIDFFILANPYVVTIIIIR